MDGAFPAPQHHEEQSRFIAWTPPPDNYWKLNFAAVYSLQLGTCGAAVVIRDDFGRFKAAAAEDLTITNCDKSYLWALRLGFFSAIRLGVDYIEIESDSLVTFQWLKGIVPPSKDTKKLCKECQHLLRHFQGYEVHYVSPGSNQAALLLADEATYTEGFTHWAINPPSNIELILRDDVIGRSVSHISD